MFYVSSNLIADIMDKFNHELKNIVVIRKILLPFSSLIDRNNPSDDLIIYVSSSSL